MKKAFYHLFLIIILVIVLSKSPGLKIPTLDNLLYYSICDQPIHYRVDEVDPQFKLSKNHFISNVDQAAQIWNKALDKKLFVYDPQGTLSVNLIYDGRQSLSNNVTQLENTVKSDQNSLNPGISQYQSLSSDFQQKLAALNKEIEYWNNQGGAPPEEYKKITQQQEDLKAEANRLNSMAASLNASTELYNSQVSQLNQSISSLNTALQEKPEEGIFKYPENIIEVYFDINDQELIHTLTHELGHSIGLEHINNPKAIMYFKTNSSIIPSNDDVLALKNICKKHSIFELIQHYLILISSRYKTKLQPALLYQPYLQ